MIKNSKIFKCGNRKKLIVVVLLAALSIGMVGPHICRAMNRCGIELNLFRRAKVNLADYPEPGVDYGTLNAQQRVVMDSILAACEAGEDAARIPYITNAEFDCVIAHIGMHFNTGDICKNIALRRYERVNGEWRYYAIINLDLYAQAKAYKEELDARVDAALSTLYEGTTEYKLKQVCDYIANHARYKHINGTGDPLDLLDEGAVCGAYSMLFYKMARRLGVQADICVGGGHAWNMVEFDGKTYFYDVTWYDTCCRLPWYVHSRTPWGREYELYHKAPY